MVSIVCSIAIDERDTNKEPNRTELNRINQIFLCILIMFFLPQPRNESCFSHLWNLIWNHSKEQELGPSIRFPPKTSQFYNVPAFQQIVNLKQCRFGRSAELIDGWIDWFIDWFNILNPMQLLWMILSAYLIETNRKSGYNDSIDSLNGRITIRLGRMECTNLRLVRRDKEWDNSGFSRGDVSPHPILSRSIDLSISQANAHTTWSRRPITSSQLFSIPIQEDAGPATPSLLIHRAGRGRLHLCRSADHWYWWHHHANGHALFVVRGKKWPGWKRSLEISSCPLIPLWTSRGS